MAAAQINPLPGVIRRRCITAMSALRRFATAMLNRISGPIAPLLMPAKKPPAAWLFHHLPAQVPVWITNMSIRDTVTPVGDEEAFPHRNKSLQFIMLTRVASASVKTIILDRKSTRLNSSHLG